MAVSCINVVIDLFPFLFVLFVCVWGCVVVRIIRYLLNWEKKDAFRIGDALIMYDTYVYCMDHIDTLYVNLFWANANL